MSSVANRTKMEFLLQELDRLREGGLYRACHLVQGEQAPRVQMDGRQVIMLSSNNYLGLATHPRLKAAAKEAIDRYGCGAGASRLIAGTMELHEQLEQRLARFKRTESALVFNSGYTLNLGLISTLLGREDAIFSDELNHASIVDGCRLSRASVNVYPHKDMGALEEHLARAGGARRKLIVSDGIFSMDGDIAPLSDIVMLARRYGAIVMVDDAHGTGVVGEGGRGTASLFGVEESVDIQMGTLSKALGSFGAYVAGSGELIRFLVNKCRQFIFTTALPPAVIASTMAALDILDSEPQRRQALADNGAFLREGLRQLGYDVLASETQIIPVLAGDSDLAVGMSQRLLERGVYACGVRPPTVPEGKARLRATVMATHTREDLQQALDAFAAVGKELGLIGQG